MEALVVYESVCGPTRAVAEAALRPVASPTLGHVSCHEH